MDREKRIVESKINRLNEQLDKYDNDVVSGYNPTADDLISIENTVFQLKIEQNKLKIIELEIEYAAKTKGLEYEIALLKLIINGYEIGFNKATAAGDDAREKRLVFGSLIKSARDNLFLLQQQEERQQVQQLGEQIFCEITIYFYFYSSNSTSSTTALK